MSEMVERVARAICRANCSGSMMPDEIVCQVENGWDMWKNEARAAIAAMRPDIDKSPDDEARAIAVASLRPPSCPVAVLEHVESWIDEALR